MRSDRLRRFRASERLTDLGLGGLWRYSAERLFVLEEAMRRSSLDRCLHIESDTLLYVDPASYEPWLAEHHADRVATCPLTDTEDTAAVLYVGSLRALERFNDALLELVALGPELIQRHGGDMANEMRMLHLLRTEHRVAEALPTTPEAALAQGAGVVFDPASYGQAVDGIPGAPGVPYAGEHHHIGREILAGRWRVRWDAQCRQPSVERRSDGLELPLANLHVHSKRLERWTSEVAPPGPPRPPSGLSRAAGRARGYLRAARRRIR
jgi:hypothetical protein